MIVSSLLTLEMVIVIVTMELVDHGLSWIHPREDTILAPVGY